MLHETLNPQIQLEFMQQKRERIQRDFREAQTMPLWLVLRAFHNRARTLANRMKTQQMRTQQRKIQQTRWQELAAPTLPRQIMDGL